MDAPARTQATVEVIGVYHVEATEPCHLIELIVRDYDGALDLRDFTQEIPGHPRDNWLVPWGEQVLDPTGTRLEGDPFAPSLECAGSLRLTFFLHHLACSRPLLTPLGPVALPAPTAKPMRLHFVEYESPD